MKLSQLMRTVPLAPLATPLSKLVLDGVGSCAYQQCPCQDSLCHLEVHACMLTGDERISCPDTVCFTLQIKAGRSTTEPSLNTTTCPAT